MELRTWVTILVGIRKVALCPVFLNAMFLQAIIYVLRNQW